jgi:hypothetical protein
MHIALRLIKAVSSPCNSDPLEDNREAFVIRAGLVRSLRTGLLAPICPRCAYQGQAAYLWGLVCNYVEPTKLCYGQAYVRLSDPPSLRLFIAEL